MGGAGQAAPGDLSKVTGLRGQVCGSCRRRTSDQGGCPEAPGALFQKRPLPGPCVPSGQVSLRLTALSTAARKGRRSCPSPHCSYLLSLSSR